MGGTRLAGGVDLWWSSAGPCALSTFLLSLGFRVIGFRVLGLGFCLSLQQT